MEPGVNPTTGIDERALGLRLQEARKKAGLTQQELCERANLAYSTLAKIERGAIKSPSIFTIISIAGVLHLTLDQLIGQSAIATPKQTSQTGVKFVYFDINGCLVRFFHRAFTKLAEQSGAPADFVETTFWHYNDAVCRGDMPLDEFNQILATQLHLDIVDWNAYYLEAIDPIQETHALLPWVAQHYRVGLLSNIMPGLINAMRKNGSLPNLTFDAIIDSSEVHAIKPEAHIYEIAQQHAGVEPHQILLIDDSRANLMAAERMGWHVLWFDDYRPPESVKRIQETLAFEQ